MRALAIILLIGIAGEVAAQGPGARPSIIANPDMLARELDVRGNADKICWQRQDPLTVDWLAERDAQYRRGTYARYHLAEIDDGWRWVRRDGGASPDLRTSDAAVKGVPYTELEVHTGMDSGWAEFVVDSPINQGRVRFDWSLPPARICMADGLHLEATAEVIAGDPGAHNVFYVLPLDPEQRAAEGAEVKACSPQATTGIDSAVDYLTDAGACHRELYHLDASSEWSLWVRLPADFFVVYRYAPADREK